MNQRASIVPKPMLTTPAREIISHPCATITSGYTARGRTDKLRRSKKSAA